MAKRFTPRSQENKEPEVKKQGKFFGKKVEKRQVKKSIQTKVVTYLVWGIMAAFFLVAFYFLTSVNSILSNQKSLQQQNEKLEQRFSALSKNNESSGNFDVFNRAFIVAFYNTKEDQLKYKEALIDYFPPETQIPSNDPGKSAKKVTSIQQWEIRKEKSIHHVKYLVHYQINDQHQRELICYTVKEKGNKYVIQSIPYKKKPESMNNNKILKAPEIPTRSEDQVEANKKTEINTWLNKTFFPKFVETDDQSLVKYMMKKPEVLGGTTSYVGIKDVAIYPDGKNYEAFVLIEVSDTGTDQIFENCYRLFISKDEKGQFFIDKLVHQFD